MSYYIASMYSSTGSSDYTCVWIDTNGYTMDGTTFTDRNWATATGFMYVGDDKGAIGWGKTTISTNDPDVYTYLTVGATGFKNGIYADTNGLYAVVDGTAIPYDSWGSDPLYTQGDFQNSVIDRLATPPSGVNGERYLIIATASGDWTGHEDEITEYQDGWVFITESEGMMTWVEDEDVYYVYGGSSWAEFSVGGVDNLNDIGDVVISGTPANNELLAYDTGGNWINQTATESGLAVSGHTHSGVYEPYDTAIVKSNVNEIITGTWNFDTDNGAHPLRLSRIGGSTNQLVDISVLDRELKFLYIEDNAEPFAGAITFTAKEDDESNLNTVTLIDSTDGSASFPQDMTIIGDLNVTGLTTSILYSGDQDYKGIYWGAKYEDILVHSGAWAYIRQGATAGQLEMGSDDKIDIYETDSRVLAVTISTNDKTLDAKGGLLENGVALSTIYSASGHDHDVDYLAKSANVDIGTYYFEGDAFRSNSYDVQIKPLNDNYLHVRNKADTAYKPVAALSFYSSSTAHATTDTDKFIVDDNSTLKYRTGAEVLSDIGGGGGSIAGTYYIYIPACAWNFGSMHNDADHPSWHDSKSLRATYGGTADPKYQLFLPISAWIPIHPEATTVTITQVDVRTWNEGGGAGMGWITSFKTNWDDNPNDTLTPIQAVECDLNQGTSATFSLTTDIVISSGDIAYVEYSGGGGWRYVGNAKVTYTIS